MESLVSLSGATPLSTAIIGFLLGWSVAWPPGPVNMEIVRRGSLHGFWAGYSLCLGGVAGDAIWALAIFLGTSALAVILLDSGALIFVSLSILCLLACHYLYQSAKDFARWREGIIKVEVPALESSRNGFLLGLLLTTTSPWSIAFWLGVSGLVDHQGITAAAVTLLIFMVVLGAATWGLVLSSAVYPLRPFLQKTSWHAMAKGLTGLFLLWIVVSRTLVEFA
ncbi:MAG: LysE family transporter [Pseudomonadota bacterium]